MAEALKLFPVQLRRIGIAEVALRCPAFGNPGAPFSEKVDLATGVGPYDAENRVLQVLVTATAGNMSVPSTPSLRVTVVGEFHIPDESQLSFPIEKLPQWAGRNGAVVLMPFLREQVYAFTQNTGYAPVIFPLVEVPLFKVSPPEMMHAPLSGGPTIKTGALQPSK